MIELALAGGGKNEWNDGMDQASWHRLGQDADIAEGDLAVFGVGGWQILIARSAGELIAVNDRCTHQGARLSNGRIRRGAIMCPLHGARFDLVDGRCLGADYAALRRFDLRVIDGGVEVLVPDTPPDRQETALPV